MREIWVQSLGLEDPLGKGTDTLLQYSGLQNWGPRAAAAAKSLQSCLTLCNLIDSSPPAPLFLGFSRQEHWSMLPFPSPMHESEK